MKPIRFLGDAPECLREFPEDARHDAAYQLDQIQGASNPAIQADDFGWQGRRGNSGQGRQDIQIARDRYADRMRARQ